MGRLRRAATTVERAESCLLRAVRSTDPVKRLSFANAGLAVLPRGVADDTYLLLLRQVYVSHLETRNLERAAQVAAAMARIGSLRDIAHHDAARVLHALGDVRGAVLEQRRAARHAPPERRS